MTTALAATVPAPRSRGGVWLMCLIRAALIAVLVGVLLGPGPATATPVRLAAPPATPAGDMPTDTDPSTQPEPDPQPEPEPDPGVGTVRVTLTGLTRTHYGIPVTLTVQVATVPSDGSAAVPVAGTTVTVARADGDTWIPVRHLATGGDGHARLAVRLPAGRHRLRAEVAASPGGAASVSSLLAVDVVRARTRFEVGDRTVLSERRTRIVARLASGTAQRALGSARVSVASRRPGTGRWLPVATVRADADGVVRVPVRVWRSAVFRFTYRGTGDVAPATARLRVSTRGQLPRARQAGPAPRVRYPLGSAPVGVGAHVRTGLVPDRVWARMVGVSWRPGCPVGRADLRYLTVNYWGFDGYRHRGELVVHRTVAARVGGVFTDLYRQRFRIRSMYLPDRYGTSPLGPGANDYASMAADNTSGFNCRYVVGKEPQRVWSPHAYGTAVDVNTWENPYVAPTGVFPNRHYLTRRAGPGVLTAAAVAAFTKRGFFWGGRWAARDLHHFQD